MFTHLHELQYEMSKKYIKKESLWPFIIELYLQSIILIKDIACNVSLPREQPG